MPSPSNKKRAEQKTLEQEAHERLKKALIREKAKKYRIPLPDNQKGFYLVDKEKYNNYLQSLQQ